jgi:hypothetical protein
MKMVLLTDLASDAFPKASHAPTAVNRANADPSKAREPLLLWPLPMFWAPSRVLNSNWHLLYGKHLLLYKQHKGRRYSVPSESSKSQELVTDVFSRDSNVARTLTGVDQAQSDALMRGWKQSAICADINIALSNTETLRQLGGIDESPDTPILKPSTGSISSGVALPCPQKDNAQYEQLRHQMVQAWQTEQSVMMGGMPSSLGNLYVSSKPIQSLHVPSAPGDGFLMQANEANASHLPLTSHNFGIDVDLPQSPFTQEAYLDVEIPQNSINQTRYPDVGPTEISTDLFSSPNAMERDVAAAAAAAPGGKPPSYMMNMLFGNFYPQDAMQLEPTEPAATTGSHQMLNDAMIMDDFNTPEHRRQFFINLGITNFSRDGLTYLPFNLRETAEASGLFKNTEDHRSQQPHTTLTAAQILSRDMGLP